MPKDFTMTESEWLECEDSKPMLEFLRGKASDRKLTLFNCAAMRSWLSPGQNAGEKAIEVTERRADQQATREEEKMAWADIGGVTESPPKGKAEWLSRQRHLTRLLRCILGNPFRPVTTVPSWLTPSVKALAQIIYDERTFDQMPILGDELAKSGCADKEILGHCRGSGPHVRGCWVVDLVLGKG
jgi:hypothetical protein